MVLHRIAAAALMAATLTVAPLAGAAPVHVELAPASVMLAPGEEFTVELTVTQGGQEFNGFNAFVFFSPGRVEMIPGSQAIGPVLTQACGSFFHRFTPHYGHAEIHVSMLCGGTVVTGPGVVYRLRFRALDTPGPSEIDFTAQFYRAGLALGVVDPSGTDLCISDCVTAVDGFRPPDGGVEMAPPAPNPRSGVALGRLSFTLPSDDLVRIDLIDAAGRIVARRDALALPAGRHRIDWRLPVLPAGVYHARLTTRSSPPVARRWVFVR